MKSKSKPSELSSADFVEIFGSIYEHSSWVAESLVAQAKAAELDTLTDMQAAMRDVVETADEETKLALIRAHPDLAGKAAMSGELTVESTSEQVSAGLDQLTEAEFAMFQSLNDEYLQKFEFPFIKAIKRSNKVLILAAYEERLPNNAAVEFRTALDEIHKIAGFRLADLIAD